MTRLVAPTVTDVDYKRELVEGRIEITKAAQELWHLLNQNAPLEQHYPDAAAYERARTAWNERMDAVQRLQGEIETEAMRITLG